MPTLLLRRHKALETLVVPLNNGESRNVDLVMIRKLIRMHKLYFTINYL